MTQPLYIHGTSANRNIDQLSPPSVIVEKKNDRKVAFSREVGLNQFSCTDVEVGGVQKYRIRDIRTTGNFLSDLASTRHGKHVEE